jgi:uncharacterized alpha-E superfamily protein
MSASDSPPTPDLRTDSYDVMLERLDKSIEQLTEKITEGRIRDDERERTRCKMYRTLGYLIRTRAKVMEDATLQELEAEIERLKSDGDADDVDA